MRIIYTKHAKFKFEVFSKHRFKIGKNKVKKVLQKPNIQGFSEWPKIMAVGSLDKKHSLVVVYRREDKDFIIISFWPAEKDRYESKIQ